MNKKKENTDKRNTKRDIFMEELLGENTGESKLRPQDLHVVDYEEKDIWW